MSREHGKEKDKRNNEKCDCKSKGKQPHEQNCAVVKETNHEVWLQST